MSFNNIETNSYCVGGGHISATKNTNGSITSKGNKVLFGYCSICNRKKTMKVSDNTIKAVGLGSFFNNLGKISAKAGKKLASNAPKNPVGFLEIGANVATAAASRNPKAALATLPEVINFYYTGKGMYLGKFKFLYIKKMETKTDRLYPSAPLTENIDLEQRLEKK